MAETQKTSPTNTPAVYAVGMCFTRGDETLKGVKNAFLRTENNALKIDDLVATLMTYGVYEGGNASIMLDEVDPLDLEAMMEELRGAGHGKTVSFIEDFFEENDCTEWCIVVMEDSDPDDEFQGSIIQAINQL